MTVQASRSSTVNSALVSLRQARNGVWLAVAELAGSPEPVSAARADLALLLALWPLGEDVAQRMTANADPS